MEKQVTVRATDSKTPKRERAMAAKAKLENTIISLIDLKAQRAEDQRIAMLEKRRLKRLKRVAEIGY